MPQHRERQYILFRHKIKSTMMRAPLNHFLQRLNRKVLSSWIIFADSTREELELELARACGRHDSHAAGTITISTPDAFERSLSSLETKFLQAYRARFGGDEIACFSLNQNPEAGFGLHSSGNVLHTLIKNVHMLWCDEPGLPDGAGNIVRRWLTPRELLPVFVCACRRVIN